MPQATLRSKSNAGIVAISEAHPNSPFEVFGAWPIDQDLRLLLQTETVDTGRLKETLASLPEIHDFEFRHSDDQRVLFEVSTSMPEPHGAMTESGIVPSFPLHLEDGWLISDLVASQEQLSTFRAELSAANIEHQISQVSPEPDPSSLLTERQREVIEVAFDRGYYEVSRGCTLTRLAETLDVNKSVVSRVLHRAEGRIINEFLIKTNGTLADPDGSV